jgi:putative ABC transport system permease protein
MYFVMAGFRNLRHRPVRSGLTILGVAVAVGTFVALLGVAGGVEKAWTGSLTARGIHLVGVRKGSVEPTTSTLDQKLVAEIRRIPGVSAAAGELFDLVRSPSGVILVTGWEPNSFLWDTLSLVEGRPPKPEDGPGAVLGQRLAKRLSLGIGDQLPLNQTVLKITGLARQDNVLNDNLVIVPLPLMQHELGKSGVVTIIDMRLSHPENQKQVSQVQSRLTEEFSQMDFFETREMAANNHMLHLLKRLNQTISLIALCMALFFIINTLLMSVNESTREIGILSALGWSRRLILGKTLLEGLLLTLLGGSIGIGIGAASLAWLQTRPQLQAYIEFEFDLFFGGQILLGIVVLGVAGSLYPAWIACRKKPVDALKYE